MPVCFQLTRKGEKEPSSFQHIDDLLCAEFNVPVDDKRYLAGWYDSIGLRLALGKTFDEIEKEFRDYADERYDLLLKINDYLRQHYTTDAWYERGNYNKD